MINLYEYYKATRDECIDDLYEVLENISNFDDYDTLKRKAIRLQNIAQRLKELGE